MAASNDISAANAPEAPLFSALLTPHRALNRTSFALVMGLIAAMSFVCGLVFWRMGAWPVAGFFSLDLLAIYLAFRLNFKRANATEEITVTHSEFRVRRVDHKGAVSETVFNPLWVKLDREIDEDFGMTGLFVISRGRRLNVAGFLGPDEKLSFANALSAALTEARRGPTWNPLS